MFVPLSLPEQIRIGTRKGEVEEDGWAVWLPADSQQYKAAENGLKTYLLRFVRHASRTSAAGAKSLYLGGDDQCIIIIVITAAAAVINNNNKVIIKLIIIILHDVFISTRIFLIVAFLM